MMLLMRVAPLFEAASILGGPDMSRPFHGGFRIITAFWGVVVICQVAGYAADPTELLVDFRYSIPWWQTAICLPDDPQKTVVGKDGELLYEYQKKKGEFATRVSVGMAGDAKWLRQELASPRIPVVRTTAECGAIEMVQEAFAAPPADGEPSSGRWDIVLVHFYNKGEKPAVVHPMVTIESSLPVQTSADGTEATVGDSLRLGCSAPVGAATPGDGKLVLRLEPIALPIGGRQALAVSVALGKEGPPALKDMTEIELLRARANRYWTDGRIPYDRLQVPDAGIQALIDSSIRNIYQAREIKNGLPAFQVGPTCYRGLWIVDGAFLLETAAYLGCVEEARSGIDYLLGHQRDDGGFTVIPAHWKESGIVLWTVTRHAKLTGDKEWLAKVWPRLERTVAFIGDLRRKASQDPGALCYGLVPPGFSDGGLQGRIAEYTNVYWTLAGMRAAVDAARWIGRHEQADAWQREYDALYAAFCKAAARDMQTDAHGNRYLPIAMGNVGHELPQRAQWAFCHAVFPGKVFSSEDALVRGNLAMLEATQQEGMVVGTGWAAQGIWTYFASFYGHAWLWLGDGRRAAASLYAFANHASPLLAWREEQMLQGQGSEKVGDMPHNWASAEFIRLVRHLLVLERNDDLHLFEGMPREWVKPGALTRLKDIATEFGPLSLDLQVAQDGRTAKLTLQAPSRTPARRIILHLGRWADPSNPHATVELPQSGTIERTITLMLP